MQICKPWLSSGLTYVLSSILLGSIGHKNEIYTSFTMKDNIVRKLAQTSKEIQLFPIQSNAHFARMGYKIYVWAGMMMQIYRLNGIP